MIPRCDVQSTGSARKAGSCGGLVDWGSAVRQQHEQTTDSTRRAWCWIFLGLTLAPCPVWAQSRADSTQLARSAEPIGLTAGSIRYWEQGAEQWLLLQGRSRFSKA